MAVVLLDTTVLIDLLRGRPGATVRLRDLRASGDVPATCAVNVAGVWRRDHAARGVTLAQADCLIAAPAVTALARLATGNPRDFPMAGVVVEHWPVGE